MDVAFSDLVIVIIIIINYQLSIINHHHHQPGIKEGPIKQDSHQPLCLSPPVCLPCSLAFFPHPFFLVPCNSSLASTCREEDMAQITANGYMIGRVPCTRNILLTAGQ